MKIAYFIPLILCLGCANIIPLTGGDIDKTPPQLTSTFPKNKSVLFKENKINMKFDEAIQINQGEKLFFSPSLGKEVKLDVKGDELVIYIEEGLLENTTYTVILNNLVKDITEGNTLTQLEYTFSTGPEIDTLYIQGNVLDALNKEPLEKIRLGLYSENTSSDSLIYKYKADYLAISDKAGNFKFSNLPYNAFYLYALEDLDNNSIFSLPQEKVGFIPNSLTPSVDDLSVLLFDETALSDSVTNISYSDDKSFGSLIIESLPESPLIVELINKERIIYRTNNTIPLSIDSLNPGAYSLRIIYDENNNGKWDTGNLLQKIQAEAVEYYIKDIDIRADWDVIVEWEASE